MLTAIVFAITLVAAQTLAGLFVAKLFMSKRFVKKYYAMVMELSRELVDELEETLED